MRMDVLSHTEGCSTNQDLRARSSRWRSLFAWLWLCITLCLPPFNFRAELLWDLMGVSSNSSRVHKISSFRNVADRSGHQNRNPHHDPAYDAKKTPDLQWRTLTGTTPHKVYKSLTTWQVSISTLLFELIQSQQNLPTPIHSSRHAFRMGWILSSAGLCRTCSLELVELI
jgi:hypothetical protein